ncbi:MAG: enoyl-CoA hydratase/isomerase family protein [Rhizobiaceae bacterium]|nr:enoyl-CoA hydratase/isomerase family protein [Rhizobiaceae bacterium]
MVGSDIHIRKEGLAGRITLSRPDALNALTYDMIIAIEDILAIWAKDDGVHLVLIDGEGRAFCAGGDIQELYDTGMAGDFEFGRKFWADEYRLNAAIANFLKPFVALVDGIVMGGGVGIACHGSHRIVTENTMLAMPESAIGLIPDVGGSFLLSQAPGFTGEYLAATGARLNAFDAIYAGFADIYVNSERLEELVRVLVHTGDAGVIEKFSDRPEPGFLKQQQETLKRCFAQGDAAEIAAALDAENSEWAKKQAKTMRRNCPISVACAIEIVRRCRKLSRIEDALALEYRFSYRSMSDGELLEGIRAQIIDKDRNPNWKIADLGSVGLKEIEYMLAPLGDQELQL